MATSEEPFRVLPVAVHHVQRMYQFMMAATMKFDLDSVY
jgi:hypothetical protein